MRSDACVRCGHPPEDHVDLIGCEHFGTWSRQLCCCPRYEPRATGWLRFLTKVLR